MRPWEERLAKLKQQSGKSSRAFVELQNSQNFNGEEEDQQPAPQAVQSKHKVREMENGCKDAAKVILCHDVW